MQNPIWYNIHNLTFCDFFIGSSLGYHVQVKCTERSSTKLTQKMIRIRFGYGCFTVLSSAHLYMQIYMQIYRPLDIGSVMIPISEPISTRITQKKNYMQYFVRSRIFIYVLVYRIYIQVLGIYFFWGGGGGGFEYTIRIIGNFDNFC